MMMDLFRILKDLVKSISFLNNKNVNNKRGWSTPSLILSELYVNHSMRIFLG